jgi:uncharacterized protein
MIEFNPQEAEYLVPGAAGPIQCKTRAGASEKRKQGDPIAIICHPHPLYEGTMDNKVVTTLARVFRDQGIDQLRFNFRGVGKSEGSHDNMIGESEDLELLMDMLSKQQGGQRFILAGFSFGSGVASIVTQRRNDIDHLVMVAPPIGKYESAYSDSYPCPVSIYQGSADDVVEPQLVTYWAAGIKTPSQLSWFEDVGHFFHGRLIDLSQSVVVELRTRGIFPA